MLRRHDDGSSEIVGTMLMIAIVVGLVVSFAFLLARIDPPQRDDTSEIHYDIQPGPDGQWNTGDELLVMRHLGGPALSSALTTLRVDLDGNLTNFAGPTMGGAWADGSFSHGERWTASFTVDLGSRLRVLTLIPTSNLIQSEADLRPQRSPGSSGPGGGFCDPDLAPPFVSLWTQVPSDVNTATVGAVTITLLAIDGCSGVDDDVDPHLWYRIQDGGSPSFSDAGAMTNIGSGLWTGIIPAQTWASLGGDTLQYYAAGLTDVAGNSGNSAVRSDVLDGGSVCNPDVTPPSVSIWLQQPANLDILSSGSVEITVTLTDDCGVDQTALPDLWFRVDDGTSPSFTNLGDMTWIAASTWTGTIPAQAWALLGGDTLQYYVTGMLDKAGNSADSSIRTDPIDALSGPFDPGFAYHDLNCDLTFDVGEDIDVTLLVIDGDHQTPECLVIPPSVPEIIAPDIDFQGKAVYIGTNLIATGGGSGDDDDDDDDDDGGSGGSGGKILIKSTGNGHDVIIGPGVTIHATNGELKVEAYRGGITADGATFLTDNGKIYLNAKDEALSAVGATMTATGGYIDLKAETTIDLTDAVLLDTDKKIKIKGNDAFTGTGASFTAPNDDIKIEARGDMHIEGAFFDAGDDLILDVRRSAHTFYVEGAHFHDADDIADVKPNSAPVNGTPAYGGTA